MSRSVRANEVPEYVPGDDEGRGALQLALLGLIVLGAFLRFYRLGGQSLWVDEVMTLMAANVGGELGLRAALWNIQGPLHTALIHWVSTFSTSEAALRCLSAVAGVASIPVVYLLGRDMADRKVGLMAAALFAVSPFAVWYSQEVRNYSFLILFAAMSTLLAWRILTGRGRLWCAYALFVVLALYSNLSAAFLVLAHNVFALGRVVRERGLLRRWVLIYVGVALLFLPMLASVARWAEIDEVGERVAVLNEVEEGERLRGATTFAPMAVPYSLFTMVYGYSLGPSVRELHVRPPVEAYGDHLLLVVPAGLVALAAAVLGVRRLATRKNALALVGSMVIVTLAAAALLAVLNIKPFNVRYIAVVLPVFVVTLAAGTASLGRTGALLFVGLVAFSLVSLTSYYWNPDHGREDVRAAARYVADNELAGDVALVPVIRDVFEHYYEGDAELYILYPGQARSEEEVARRVEAGAAGYRRLWLVDSRLWHVDPERMIPAYLSANYTELERREFPGTVVSLYSLVDGPASE